MDPAGILMLRSVRMFFEIIGIQPESIKFKKEEFNSSNLVQALKTEPKKCPTVVTFNLFEPSLHVMVATNALKGWKFTHDPLLLEKWFINCKNSYRDDISQPNTVKIPLEMIKPKYYDKTEYRFIPKMTAFYITIEE